jgi:hypothetical protein
MPSSPRPPATGRPRVDPEATAAEILAFQEGALILWRLDPDHFRAPVRRR